MRTIIWFLYFWLYLILVLPEYWRVCRMGKQGKTEQHNRLVRTHVNNWAGRLLRLAGAATSMLTMHWPRAKTK